MFANPAVADLHLLASATNAIDKGLTLTTVTNDFDGDRRPRGARSDVGADEFTTNAPPQITGVKVVGTNVVMRFTTFFGESYDGLRADALAGVSWTAKATNLPGTGQLVQITDTNGTSRAQRFYRVRIAP
jgi:hypothetical protein